MLLLRERAISSLSVLLLCKSAASLSVPLLCARPCTVMLTCALFACKSAVILIWGALYCAHEHCLPYLCSLLLVRVLHPYLCSCCAHEHCRPYLCSMLLVRALHPYLCSCCAQECCHPYLSSLSSGGGGVLYQTGMPGLCVVCAQLLTRLVAGHQPTVFQADRSTFLLI